jgi:hypothetical protein
VVHLDDGIVPGELGHVGEHLGDGLAEPDAAAHVAEGVLGIDLPRVDVEVADAGVGHLAARDRYDVLLQPELAHPLVEVDDVVVLGGGGELDPFGGVLEDLGGDGHVGVDAAEGVLVELAGDPARGVEGAHEVRYSLGSPPVRDGELRHEARELEAARDVDAVAPGRHIDVEAAVGARIVAGHAPASVLGEDGAGPLGVVEGLHGELRGQGAEVRAVAVEEARPDGDARAPPQAQGLRCLGVELHAHHLLLAAAVGLRVGDHAVARRRERQGVAPLVVRPRLVDDVVVLVRALARRDGGDPDAGGRAAGGVGDRAAHAPGGDLAQLPSAPGDALERAIAHHEVARVGVLDADHGVVATDRHGDGAHGHGQGHVPVGADVGVAGVLRASCGEEARRGEELVAAVAELRRLQLAEAAEGDEVRVEDGRDVVVALVDHAGLDLDVVHVWAEDVVRLQARGHVLPEDVSLRHHRDVRGVTAHAEDAHAAATIGDDLDLLDSDLSRAEGDAELAEAVVAVAALVAAHEVHVDEAAAHRGVAHRPRAVLHEEADLRVVAAEGSPDLAVGTRAADELGGAGHRAAADLAGAEHRVEGERRLGGGRLGAGEADDEETEGGDASRDHAVSYLIDPLGAPGTSRHGGARRRRGGGRGLYRRGAGSSFSSSSCCPSRE